MTSDDRARFTFRLPFPLLAKVKNAALREGVSINAIILKILWQYVETKESEAVRS